MVQKPPPAVGARAKIERAKQLEAMGYFDGTAGAKVDTIKERIYSTLAIVALAMGLSWLLTDGLIAQAVFPAVGNPLVDGVLLAPVPPTFIGVPVADLALIVVLRGIILLLAAGFIPLVGWVWAELLDRHDLSPWRTVWGVTLGVAVAILLLKPVFAMIFNNFGMLFG
jgi:hypothetical protein